MVVLRQLLGGSATWRARSAKCAVGEARPGRYVCFSVRDNGVGIPETLLRWILAAILLLVGIKLIAL